MDGHLTKYTSIWCSGPEQQDATEARRKAKEAERAAAAAAVSQENACAEMMVMRRANEIRIMNEPVMGAAGRDR